MLDEVNGDRMKLQPYRMQKGCLLLTTGFSVEAPTYPDMFKILFEFRGNTATPTDHLACPPEYSNQVEGMDVQFPVQPLDAQRLVMAAALRAMRERSVAFVESPTGLVGGFLLGFAAPELECPKRGRDLIGMQLHSTCHTSFIYALHSCCRELGTQTFFLTWQGTGKTLALLSASLAYQHFQQKSAEVSLGSCRGTDEVAMVDDGMRS